MCRDAQWCVSTLVKATGQEVLVTQRERDEKSDAADVCDAIAMSSVHLLMTKEKNIIEQYRRA